ncbi:hypothetical protein [Gimesia aquarii]|uniref:CdiI immunity protein domain-containing protein n=1 Tax=Gimesia aquarii TaxID=2527964 RepID=A0A517X185_9PLAN|nr:hypothetical protein [Gimesia aquarii]QDU11260.1 hypothetical protein V202x_46790 [Gimesia aquarii]
MSDDHRDDDDGMEESDPFLFGLFEHLFDDDYPLSEEVIQFRKDFTVKQLGDYLAEYKHYDRYVGEEAIHKWIMDKYSWLPHQIKELSWGELDFILRDNEINEAVQFGHDKYKSD